MEEKGGGAGEGAHRLNDRGGRFAKPPAPFGIRWPDAQSGALLSNAAMTIGDPARLDGESFSAPTRSGTEAQPGPVERGHLFGSLA